MALPLFNCPRKPVTFGKCYEPLRPLRAPDNGSAFYEKAWGTHRVHYGELYWPSKSYWLVPSSDNERD